MAKHLLLQPSDFQPYRKDLTVIGAFNPGATVYKNQLVLLVRVAVDLQDPSSSRFSCLQFIEGKLDVSWHSISDFDSSDKRVYRRLQDGKILLSSISYFQIVWIDNYLSPPDQWICRMGDMILPEGPFETYGIEDARLTWVDEICYITYTSVSSHGACTSLMTTTDFAAFDRHGVIFVCENKDVVLFPERIERNIYALHRPVSATPFCKPEIWTASSLDGKSWGNHHVLAAGKDEFETDRIGAGSPPIRIGDDFVAFYHASEKAVKPARVGRYVGALMRMSINNGRVILIKKASSPLLVPSEPWELDGFIPNVVFPTATIPGNAELLVLYGAADTCAGVAQFEYDQLLENLR